MSKAVAAAATETEPGLHEGIKLAEVDKPRLRKFLGSKQASTVKLVDEYLARMAEQKKAGAKFVTCNQCNALLVEDQQECPVCGDVDEADSLDVAKAIVVDEDSGEVVHQSELVVDDLEQRLNESVARCREYISNLLESHWDLGREMFKMHSEKLYLGRKDGAGKPMYRYWEEFCKKELGMSTMHAFDAMKVSKLFSKSDVRKLGFAKLKVIATANIADQARLFEMAKEDVSLREIIKAKKSSPLYVERGPGGLPGPAARKRPSAPVSAVAQVTKQHQDVKGGITVVFQLKKTQIKLEKDPKSLKLRGREELANAVVTYYEFDPKTRVMSITREREES